MIVRRLQTIALAFVLAVMVLAGCTQDGSPPSINYEHGEFWSVTVEKPRFHEEEQCGQDPAVKLVVISTDVPSSAYYVELQPNATREDADRIASCLRRFLESGTLTVAGPSER